MTKVNRKSQSKSSKQASPCDLAVKSHPALGNSIVYCLVKSGVFLRTLMDTALAESKIISPQYAILTILVESGPMSQIEIGTVLSIDKATMVKLIDDLEDQKYVVRVSDKVDRRIKRVQVSAAGRRIKERAALLRAKLEKDVLMGLSTNEQKYLAEVLPKVLDHVRAMVKGL